MSQPIHVSQAHFGEQILASELPVIVDFWADWCAPCHRVAPILDDLAASHEGRAIVAKVNVDDEPELAKEYGIRSIPTFLLVRDGEVVDRVSGALSKKQLEDHVDSLVKN